MSQKQGVSISKDVHSLLSHQTILDELEKCYSKKKPGDDGYRQGRDGYGSDPLEVWDSIINNISCVAANNGSRHGCRYPEPVPRVAATLRAKIGRKQYEDL